jgi:uncharacterized membrane protein
MHVRIVVQERGALLGECMSRKSVRLVVLFGVLLIVSIAINVMIILADGSGL